MRVKVRAFPLSNSWHKVSSLPSLIARDVRGGMVPKEGIRQYTEERLVEEEPSLP